LYRECLAGAQIIFRESGRGLGHVTSTIFGSTVGYPSDSLASCWYCFDLNRSSFHEDNMREKRLFTFSFPVIDLAL